LVNSRSTKCEPSWFQFYYIKGHSSES
jgi:hypothetical protein